MECTKCKRTETARWYRKRTENPICCSCYRKEYVSKNREKALAAQRKANQSEKSKKARRDYAKSERGIEVRRKVDKKRYWSNPEKSRKRNRTEEQRERLRNHYQNNKAYYHEKTMRRNRNLEKASLGNVYKDKMIEVYANCPEGYEVDHIIPIKGYDFLNGERQHVVCGLNTYWNMQYLPKEENRSKSCNLYSMEEI